MDVSSSKESMFQNPAPATHAAKVIISVIVVPPSICKLHIGAWNRTRIVQFEIVSSYLEYTLRKSRSRLVSAKAQVFSEIEDMTG